MTNVSTDSLMSKYNTNIFKAPEATKEVTPETQVSEDVSEEPEPVPRKGICHFCTDPEEEMICPLLLKLCVSNILHNS